MGKSGGILVSDRVYGQGTKLSQEVIGVRIGVVDEGIGRATEVRGYRGEVRKREVCGEIQACQGIAIVIRLAQELAIAQHSGIQVREALIEYRGIVETQRLVTQRRANQHAARGRNAERHPAALALRPIGVRVDHRSGERVHVVDVTAVSAIPGAEAKAESVANDGSAKCRAGFVAWTAVLCGRPLDLRLATEFRQTRLTQQQPHCATLGTLTQERALRPADDLDAINIEEQRTNFAKVTRKAVQWGIVDKYAGGRSAAGVIHAADREVRRDAGADRGVKVVFDARCHGGHLLQVLGTRHIDGIGRPDHQTYRNFAYRLLAAGCEYDNFFKRHFGAWYLLRRMRWRCLGGHGVDVNLNRPVVKERERKASACEQVSQGLRE